MCGVLGIFERTLRLPEDLDPRTPELTERFERARSEQKARDLKREWVAKHPPKRKSDRPKALPKNVLLFGGAAR